MAEFTLQDSSDPIPNSHQIALKVTMMSFTTTFVDIVIVGVLKQNIYNCLYSYSSLCGQPLSITQLFHKCTFTFFFFKLLLVCFH